MKFAVSTILFAGAGIFFSAVAGQQDPKKFDFLRAWVDPGDDTTVPPISHYVEIDMAGNAVINMTDGSQGVKSVCRVPDCFIIIIIIIIISILFI